MNVWTQNVAMLFNYADDSINIEKDMTFLSWIYTR